MESIKKTMQTHKTLSYVLVFGLIVFFNCFGFPVYNLNKAWPFWIRAEYIFNLVWCAVLAGGLLAGAFPERRCGFIAALAAALVCAGLGCRFLLEFGEVSNTYNFTLPNMALHIAAFVVLTALSWSQAGKHGQKAG